MSKSPKTPEKRTSKFNCRLISISNGKTNISNKQQSARNFCIWYKQIIDDERQKLGLYLSEDITLKWFGRTVRSRKKVYSFFVNHVDHSKHYLTSFDCISKLQILRQKRSPRKTDSIISPLCSPELKELHPKNGKRRLFQSPCKSPEWALGCKPDEECNASDKKRLKSNQIKNMDLGYEDQDTPELKHNSFELNNKGDGVKHCVHVPTTPSNLECGQGDCLPSTSRDSHKSHENLTAQLPKLAVECNGLVEFTRSKNNRADCVQWERKCKLQICYSEDIVNVGEYIIWTIDYSDESKCRRNLLADFNDISKDESD